MIKELEPQVDFFEVRMDLIGPGWLELAKMLNKPWIACNRRQEEGGQGEPDEIKREKELLWAAEAGAEIVDIEYQTRNLAEFVPLLKDRSRCLISFHDLVGTPSFKTLVAIVENQIRSGAEICKVVTTAQDSEDNFTLLRLIHEFPETKMVALAMGEPGRLSRILSPLAGGYLTFASAARGKESAGGQMTVSELRQLYEYLRL
jgi:3-dehydroquinate dehydratase I